MNNNEGNFKKLRGKDDRSIPTLFKIAMWPKLVSEDSHKVPLFCLVGSSPTIATWKTNSNFFIYKNWVLCFFNVFRKLSGHHLNGCRILFWYSNNLGSNPSDPTNNRGLVLMVACWSPKPQVWVRILQLLLIK